MNDLGTFYSWTVVSENEAIKQCDKSFFEHNESGVPLEIVWFFDAKNMTQGESRDIVLNYLGRNYRASIRRETHFSGRYRIVWESSLGKAFKPLYTSEKNKSILFKRIQDNFYSLSFVDNETGNGEIKTNNGFTDASRLVNVVNQFEAFIVERDGTINFQDRNTFLGSEENYKSIIAIKAQEELKYEEWTEEWLSTDKICLRVVRAMNCAGNLVNKHQQIAFKNLLGTESKSAQLKYSRIIYDIYKSKGEVEEAEAFDNAVSTLGGKYDTISYLFFIKDSSRFLPVSPGHFEKSLKLVGLDYKLAGKCGWENYNGFLGRVKMIKEVMSNVISGIEVRLIDAHSFLWVIGENERPTDFLRWTPNKKTVQKIEHNTEKWISSYAENVVQRKRSSSSYFTRSADVVRITKARAAGICELCRKPAPFMDKNGEPYLETHHIEWLSRNGLDNTDNTVALCPNCHSRMHILDDENDVLALKELRLRSYNNFH